MHRGELLKKKLDQHSVNKSDFSRRFGYKSVRSLYNQFEKPDATLDLFIFASKQYHIDFSKELHELNDEVIARMNEEWTGREKAVALELYIDTQKKYTAQLELNQKLLIEVSELKSKISKLEDRKTR